MIAMKRLMIQSARLKRLKSSDAKTQNWTDRTNFMKDLWNKNSFGPVRKAERTQTLRKAVRTEQLADITKNLPDKDSDYWNEKVAFDEENLKLLNRKRKYKDGETAMYESQLPGNKLIDTISQTSFHLDKTQKHKKIDNTAAQMDYDELVNLMEKRTKVKKEMSKPQVFDVPESVLEPNAFQRQENDKDNEFDQDWVTVIASAQFDAKELKSKKPTKLRMMQLKARAKLAKEIIEPLPVVIKNPTAGKQCVREEDVEFKGNFDNLFRHAFVKKKKDNKVIYDKVLRFSRKSQLSQENPCFFPSVSKILKESMPEERKILLQKWEQRMILQLGREGFQKYQKQMLFRGEKLHHFIESKLLQSVPDMEGFDEINENHIKSVGNILDRFSKPFAIESHVQHPELQYQGYMDCVAVYKKSDLILIDWKTSEKRKSKLSATFDNPLQIAAYAGAFNHDPKYKNVKLLQGMIVIVYNDGTKADVLSIDERLMSYYWKEWLSRLNLYKKIVAA